MGLYLDKDIKDASLIEELAREILGWDGPVGVERFCDDDGDYKRKYNVYKISAKCGSYVLKKTDSCEAAVYQTFLEGKDFAAPRYYGDAKKDGDVWILMEYVAGRDLRRFDREMALGSAHTLAELQNAYWGSDIQDGRFERYWERINRRAKCLAGEPELAEAYGVFLERQKSCPRTLSNGDFLQFNGIWRDGRVYMIDWGFGGIMPYALDVTRLIAHGTEKPTEGGFPFYMNQELRKTFLRAHYEQLEQKPGWDRYLMDIKLAALNEYVEFLEEDLNDPQVGREEICRDSYYQLARETAEEIRQG